MFRDAMFADSMLETSWAQRASRSWTTLTSFGLQALVIALLLLLPLLNTAGLPSAARTVSTPISAGRPAPEPAPTPRTGGSSVATSNSEAPRFVAPGKIPDTILMTGNDPAPQPPGGIGTGFPEGVVTGLPGVPLGGTRPVLLTALPPAPSVPVFRTSNMLEGSLIRRVQPIYPPLARSARIQGSVVLFAVISKAGTIDNLRVVSGHPMLVPAAKEAVGQ